MKANNKICVFCGRPPEEKTKEHVMPLWLMKLTGDEKRRAFFGVRYADGPDNLKVQQHDFASYTVPACAACNQRFGKLEELAKGVIERVLVEAPLDSQDVVYLLDWLDKVRIGLWHSGRMRGTNLFRPADPRFHIADRIGTGDRWARLTLLPKEAGQGLTYAGVGTPMFGSMPSAFSIRINNLLIQNASSPRIVSKWLGLPYPSHRRVRTPGGTMYRTEIKFGQNRLIPGMMDYGRPFRGLELVQPAYPFFLKHCERPFRSAYAQGFFADLERLQAKPLIVEKKSIRAFAEIGKPEYDLMRQELRPDISDVLSSSTLHLQNFVSRAGLYGSPVMTESEYRYAERLRNDLIKLNHLLLKMMAKQVADPTMSNDGSEELKAGLKMISI